MANSMSSETYVPSKDSYVLNSMESLLRILDTPVETFHITNEVTPVSPIVTLDNFQPKILEPATKEFKFINAMDRALVDNLDDMKYEIQRFYFKRSPKGKIWLFNAFNLNGGRGVCEKEAIEMLEEYMNNPTNEGYYDIVKDDIPRNPTLEEAKIWYPKWGDFLCGNIYIKDIVEYGNIFGDYLLICDRG